MKLTKQQLKKIIKEEMNNQMDEEERAVIDSLTNVMHLMQKSGDWQNLPKVEKLRNEVAKSYKN